MKLPTWTAEKALRAPPGAAYGAWAPVVPQGTGVEMMLKASCLVGCVGTRAYDCMSCGSDAACWERCAGAGAGECVQRCA